MPIYEYFCQDCKNKFDVKASMSEKEKGLKVVCPACGSKQTVQVLGGFYTFSKGRASSGGGCGPNPTPGCCG
jgi:putative FmdB family regulatory protein